MPNRMLRDWTNSDKIDSLSFQAEVFFTRLIMKADDFGCFWADAKRLKSNLYPLKSDSIRDADLLRWMAECQKAELIVVYESDGKRYLQIIDFGQRLRSKTRKFPQPPYDRNPPQSAATRGEVRLEEEVEEKKKRKEKEKENGIAHPPEKTGKKWNTMPGPEQMDLELPDITIGAVIEQFRIGKNQTVSKNQVLSLWMIFKTQNLVGEKFYQSERQVFSHFINWSRTRDVEPEQVKTAPEAGSVSSTRKKLEEVYGTQQDK